MTLDYHCRVIAKSHTPASDRPLIFIIHRDVCGARILARNGTWLRLRVQESGKRVEHGGRDIPAPQAYWIVV